MLDELRVSFKRYSKFAKYVVKKQNLSHRILRNISQFATLIEIPLWLKAIQPAFTCSKLTIETLEQDVKYVQS